MQRADAGQRQVVFLSGEAGIGKTVVLDAFLRRAAADPDWLIARGSCLEHYGAAEAYLPILEAFGRLLREPAAEPVIRVLDVAGAAAVARTTGQSRGVAPRAARGDQGADVA